MLYLGFPECWEQLDTLVQHVLCVSASVKYLMEQEKQECIPEEKEKQVNLTCWTALPWWCFLHAALLLAAPHRWQRRAPWVQNYLHFLDKYVIFLETQQRVQNPKITLFNEECPCQNFHTMILSKLKWCLLPPNEAVWILNTAFKCKHKTLRRV